MTGSGDEVLFRERQHFTQPWLWLILGGVTLLLGYGGWQQLVAGQPFGNNPASDGVLLVLLAVFGIGLPLFFGLLRLETEVTKTALRIRFFPFHRRWKEWRWEQIDRVERRTYSPLREYGGWGIRLGAGGLAYNVRGNDDIQLVLRSGQRLLIGTQDGTRFMMAVERARAA